MSEYKRVWNLVKILKNSIDIYLHMLYNMYCKVNPYITEKDYKPGGKRYEI